MSLCPTCRIGRLGKRSMAYLEWHGKSLLIANRMPAYVCDICGERMYDDEAVESLQQLLWSKPLKTISMPPGRNS